MRQYYRIILGRANNYATEAHTGNFIGAGWFGGVDLSNNLPSAKEAFDAIYKPLYLETYPDKGKISAGLACGALYMIAVGLQKGDIVLSPNGTGEYMVGEIVGDYYFAKDEHLPHRREVRWFPQGILRSSMSEALQNSAGSVGTVSNLTKYANELEGLLHGETAPLVMSAEGIIEDTIAFALEKHLEDFLVANWDQTDLGKKYDIFEEDGEKIGQQYPSDTGPLDILAISKDKKEILVVELKKGRTSDAVVGQIQRYMGFVKEELAETHQTVRGVIIAFEDDKRIQRALSVAQNIDFYTYTVQFSLNEVYTAR